MERVRRRRRRRRSRKYVLRRILVLTILLALIVGAVFLLSKLIGLIVGGKKPEATPPATLTDVAPTPEPTIPADARPVESTAAELSQMGFTTSLMINRAEAQSFMREQGISFGDDEAYTSVEGVITLGGSNYRNSFTYGTQSVSARQLRRAWEVPMGELATEQNGTWTGSGWTGMPLIIRWSDEVRPTLGVFDQYKNKQDFTEVIYPTMDGHIYFMELTTGNQTREPLNIGVVTKGTASIDPRGWPLLYTGQGIPSTVDGVYGAWFRIISLIDNKVIWSFGGQDPFSYRIWQAYDSSPLIDAKTDTLITGGENGVLYTVKLNASFDASAGTVSVSPGNLEKYRYTANGYGEADDKKWWGIENSIAAFRNYLFFTDNGGSLQCVDVNTLKLVYVKDVLDDSDTSIVIEEAPADGTFYLYTANEVDKQKGVTDGVGKSMHRKINGLTGEIVWQVEWDASIGNTSSNGGTLTTPHVGHGSIANVVIYNQTLVPVTVDGATQYGGRIVAYDKSNGTELWRYEQLGGYWSSPVVIYDENEKAYLIQCDRSGIMRMHDLLTGNVLTELDMGSRMESTPAVFDNMLVVGTRGQYGSGETQKIIGVKIQ